MYKVFIIISYNNHCSHYSSWKNLEVHYCTHMEVQMLISMKKIAERTCRMTMLHFRPTTCNKPMFRGITAKKRHQHHHHCYDEGIHVNFQIPTQRRNHNRNSRATSPRQLMRRVW